MLAGETDDEVGGRDVAGAELAAAVAGGRDLEPRERLARPPAHGHALDHVRARGRDLDVVEVDGEDRARHHRARRVPGAEEHDVRHGRAQ
ncbi:MAG TPA: hypothetical protein VFC99_21170 [Acidimicrobiia bacterium]|nr:hypothetical protein [Acidimicrobiia bacterium]